LVEGLYDAHLLDLIGVAGGAGTPEGLGQRLVEASVAASGRDNTTALVIEVGGV